MGDDERWPRPVGGHLALDFVNTDVFSGGDPATDILCSADEFRAWLSFIGSAGEMTERSPGSEHSLLDDAVALRAALRSIFETLASGGRVDAEPLAVLRDAYAEAMREATPIIDARRLIWHRDGTAARDALGDIARGAVDLLRAGSAERIKACPGCGFVFLDTTKNGSRRWCAMEDCGTQEKMRRYVTKRAARAAR
jgi:predicted RNA-binding Zn ribbon-like protein